MKSSSFLCALVHLKKPNKTSASVHRPFGHASEEWLGQTGSGGFYLSKEGHYRDATSAKRCPHKGYISELGQGSELTTIMVWKLRLPLMTGQDAVAVLLTGPGVFYFLPLGLWSSPPGSSDKCQSPASSEGFGISVCKFVHFLPGCFQALHINSLWG